MLHRCIGEHDINLTDYMKTKPQNMDLDQLVCSKENIKEEMYSKKTILQVNVINHISQVDHSRVPVSVCPLLHYISHFLQTAVLESVDTGKRVIVATTHLYFHPSANNIRLIQAAICVRYIEELCVKYTKVSMRGVHGLIVYRRISRN